MNLHKIDCPGAVFSGPLALAEFGYDAEAYERAVADFESTGDDITLTESLCALGFERDEIAWHVEHPGGRVERSFIHPQEFPFG
jgi:hypothetical protein